MENQNLQNKSVTELKKLWLELEIESQTILERGQAVMDALKEKIGAQLESQFKQKGKNSGDLSDEIEGVKVQYSISKTVKWDNDKLNEVCKLLPPEKIPAVVDVKLSISEKVFDVLSSLVEEGSDIHKLITEARTVKYGDPKITFAKKQIGGNAYRLINFTFKP